MRPDRRSLAWRGPELAPVAVTEEAHGKRLGISREGLMAGPHVAASVRERERGKKRVADTWDREGAGVHLAVAHRERERAGRSGPAR
jgi:hypothetical protein